MVNTIIMLSFLFDMLPAAALIYIFFKLRNASNKEHLSRIAKSFILHHKERLSDIVLINVIFAFFFNALALTLYIFDIRIGNMIEILEIFADALLFLFMMYFIMSKRYLGLLNESA